MVIERESRQCGSLQTSNGANVMSVALRRVHKPPASQETANRLVLAGVDWTRYRRLGELFFDRPLRMTYCDGVLAFEAWLREER